jgi:hypothetical protein
VPASLKAVAQGSTAHRRRTPAVREVAGHSRCRPSPAGACGALGVLAAVLHCTRSCNMQRTGPQPWCTRLCRTGAPRRSDHHHQRGGTGTQCTHTQTQQSERLATHTHARRSSAHNQQANHHAPYASHLSQVMHASAAAAAAAETKRHTACCCSHLPHNHSCSTQLAAPCARRMCMNMPARHRCTHAAAGCSRRPAAAAAAAAVRGETQLGANLVSCRCCCRGGAVCCT